MYKTPENEIVKFGWDRGRVFDKLTCLILMEKCQEVTHAKIVSVVKKPKTKGRPIPLNSVEAQKLISQKLRISSEVCMQIMEKLYNKGFLSYPRTETQKYNPTINLKKIVNELTNSPEIGAFATKVASGEQFSGPKHGKKDDKAHPPIHPVKYADKAGLTDQEFKIYDLLSRHFLATLAKDAKGNETKVKVEMNGE